MADFMVAKCRLLYEYFKQNMNGATPTELATVTSMITGCNKDVSRTTLLMY